MAIIVPKRKVWTGQPQTSLQINWNNPLTNNLILAYLPGSRINLVNGHQFAVTRGIITNSDGLCTNPSNTGSYIRLPFVVNASSEYAIYDIQSVSVFARMRQTSEVNTGWNFIRGNGSSAPTWGVGLHGGSLDGPTAQLGSFNYSPGTSDASMVGNVHTVCIAGDGANLSLYYDKKIITNNTAYTTTVPQYNSIGRQVIIGSDASAFSGLNTQTSLALLFSGRISSEKYFELERNPWQIFAPRKTSVYFPFMGIRSPNIGYERKVWTRQPQNALELKPEYATLFTSLSVLSVPPKLGYDSAKNKFLPFTKSGSVTDSNPTAFGIGPKAGGTTSDYYSRTVSVTPQAMWMVAVFVPTTLSTTGKTNYALGSASASSGAYSVIFSGGSSQNNVLCQFRGVDGGSAISKAGPVPVVGKMMSVVFVCPSNLTSAAYMYVDGSFYNAAATGDADTTFTTTLVNESIGALKRGTVTNPSTDTVLLVGYGLGQIPAALAQKLSENPWQIFAPNRQLLYNNPTLFYTRQLPNYSVNVLQNDSNKNYQLPATNLNVGNVVQNVQLTYLQPNSDKIIGNWVASTGNTLYGVLRDSSAGDSDYIQSTSATSCEIKLETGSTPISKDNHSLKYRLLSGSGNLEVSLRQGYPNLYVPERKVWSRQPVYQNSNYKGLEFLLSPAFSNSRDLITKARYTNSGSVGIPQVSYHAFSPYVRGADQVWERFAFTNFKSSTDYSAFALVHLDSGSATVGNPIDGDDGVNNRVFQVRINGSNLLPQAIIFNTSGGLASVTGSSALPTNKPVFMVITVKQNTLSIYTDGNLNGTPSTLTGTIATLATENGGFITIGAMSNPNQQIFLGKIYLAGYFSRALPEEEIKSLSENPWQLFTPRRQYFPLNQSTPIKTWNHILTDSTQVISQTLTSAEANTITNYSDLRVGLTSS